MGLYLPLLYRVFERIKRVSIDEKKKDLTGPFHGQSSYDIWDNFSVGKLCFKQKWHGCG